jgi:hypothetical protein
MRRRSRLRNGLCAVYARILTAANTWMTATVVPPRGQATRPFVAYHGAYSFDGEILITRVEAATIASWVGEDQVRSSRFQGNDRLFLRPPIREFGSQRVQQELEWVRVG